MELSVVIVNYNVKHFLEQCLASVFAALAGIDAEVFVVDNASSDNSCPMVRQKFPCVKLIENQQNVGFAKANNQAIAQSQGRYVLLLNPDTVVQENTFAKCLAFMNSHSDAGAVTVKMIDGKGNYLPESKRGFPSPWVSFFKIFGLTALFPKSKLLARYYMGHLDRNATSQIDVLPGAFMFIRKEALNRSGLLDEQFFMYGEDIDLSYRITRSGYNNYYYPECRIIHYKGESTKKGSLNYVLTFYQAMIIFAKKHFKSNRATAFVVLINIAIYFRALLSIAKRLAGKLWLPALDASLIGLGLLTITPRWENFRFQHPNIYPPEYVAALSSFYVLAWLLTLWVNGAYDKPQRLISSAKGILYGFILILVVYSVLPGYLRFSRAIIILTGVWALLSTLAVRLLLARLNPRAVVNSHLIKKIAIIGDSAEGQRVKEILDNSGVKRSYVGNFELRDNENPHAFPFERLEEFVRVNSVDELVFCPQSISMQNIVTAMLRLSPLGKEYKIAPQEGTFIIGSSSVVTAGELYALDIKAIGTQSSRRSKRLFDLLASAVAIAAFPLLLCIAQDPLGNLVNALRVIAGLRTWVGYNPAAKTDTLPRIRQGVFAVGQGGTAANAAAQNLIYARSYSVELDLKVLLERTLRGKRPKVTV